MAKWRTTLDLSDLFDGAFEGEGEYPNKKELHNIGVEIAKRIRTDLLPQFSDMDDRDKLAYLETEFSSFDGDAEEFDGLIEEMCLWGDISHRCWIKGW